MNYILHLKHLALKCLIGLLFYLMLTKSAIATFHIPSSSGEYPILDIAAVTAIKTAAADTYALLASAAATLAGEHVYINKELNDAEKSLKNINTQYRKNVDLTLAWTKDTDPNLVQLKARLSPIMSDFKALDTKAKNDLDKYESKSFLNNDANVNKGIHYGRADSVLAYRIQTNSMCQQAPNAGSNTYANLQESSCTIVHNAVAYKKALYNFTLEKQDLLKKAMKMIMDSNLVTIGEHDARKTMLLELEVLHQETTDDFKLRLNNADVQAHIARDTELYAAQAIDFGVNSSVVMEGVKGVIGTAILVGAAQVTPYNE